MRDRFPALNRLESGPFRSRVPYVRQQSATDCGPACLTSVLRLHGMDVAYQRVKEVCGSTATGTSAQMLIQGAEFFGLLARGISIDVEDIEDLPQGSVLHWGFQHFIVLDHVRTSGADIVDPGMGPRRVTQEELKRKFTGVAIVFEKTERFSPGTRRIPGLFGYLMRLLEHRALLVRVLMMSVGMQVLGLGLPVLTGLLVDRVIPHGDVDLLRAVSLGLALVLVTQVMTSLMRAHLLLNLRTQVDVQMTLEFLDHLVELPYSFFQGRSAGDLMMRLNSNSIVRETLTSTALSGVLDGTLVCTYLAVIVFVQPLLGAVVVLLGLLRIVIFLVTRHRIRDLMAEGLAAQAASSNYQVQMLQGMETLKASGVEGRAVEKWSGLFVDVLNVSLRRGRLSAVVSTLLEAVSYCSPLVVLVIGGMLVINGHLSLGSMLALSALAAGFLNPVGSLVNTAVQIQEAGSYIDRLNDVMTTEREVDRDKVSPAPVLEGRITLESVTFRYSPLVPPAVHDVSLDIRPGEMVALVGRSAAGKSTLASLLMALYRPASGRILYDQHDLAFLDVRGVRRQIGIVTQHPYFFGATVRENIALANSALSMEEVERAAKCAHLHDEIIQMPMGYDTPVLDGGQSLSGGQRQRLALARALANDPKILILDEATSALDADMERRIQDSIAGLACTRIVIAHRLSTIRSADQIIVLDAGGIVERGDHEGLMSSAGLYRDLLERQIASR
jgi:ATP-binding cassette subfamily B protein